MNAHRLIRDYLWWAALSCGPFFWLALWLWGAQIQALPRLLPNLPALLLVALVYPVLEEIVFRGGIQEWLSRRLPPKAWHGVTAANVMTSMLFTAFHFIHHPPVWALSVFLPSLVFGFFKDRYQSLLPPILIHAFYNSGYALLYMSF